MSRTSMRQYGGRNVWVHLPETYSDDTARPHHLLVLHDGQNLSPARPEAYGGSWHVETVVDRLAEAGDIPPVVVAGIDHAGRRRIQEFAVPSAIPWRARAARRYARLVFEDVLPGLARDFAVRTDVGGLTLGGSSMGALATVWLAALQPGRFGRLLVMSPSVWWRNRSILRFVERHRLDRSTRIWIDAGRQEGQEVIDDARLLAEHLQGTGCRDVRFTEDADGDHSESSWSRRLPDALRWLHAGARDACDWRGDAVGSMPSTRRAGT